MAKCPRCAERKGKRLCPALRTEICPRCCAEERLKTIACPQNCSYLEGEVYQHGRRRVRAVTQGKEFVEANKALFRTKEAHDFAFKLQADIYYFSRAHGPVPDPILAETLEALKRHSSKVLVPVQAPHPILTFLLERLDDTRRYAIDAIFTLEERARALDALAGETRRLSRGDASSTRLLERIRSFFDELDFEADLDYSPEDARAPPREEEGVRRSAGGLILPG